MTKVIDSFKGEYDWLSNFFSQPILYRNLRWLSAEHAYQAMKTAKVSEQEQIRLGAPTPAIAKRMGQRVTMRPSWDQRKLPFMKSIVDHKFAFGFLAAQKLVNTEDAILIDGNTWGDLFWGQCNGEGEKQPRTDPYGA